jgi:hypothetical protein
MLSYDACQTALEVLALMVVIIVIPNTARLLHIE